MTDSAMREAVGAAASLLAEVLAELDRREPGAAKGAGKRRGVVASVQPTPAPEFETIAQLAKRVRRSKMTVFRWITAGVAIGSNIVKLHAQRVGGLWSISREMWELFVKETNPEAPTLPDSPAAEARRIAAARKRLAELLA
jgi:hypothetical protein